MIQQNIKDVLFDIDGAILNELMPGFKEDYLVLHSLLRKYNPKTVFEIGTHIGIGTEIICNAVPNAAVFSLDLPTEQANISKHHPAHLNKGDVGNACKLPYNQILENSMMFDYLSCPCDAYFIDGEHTYENVKHETKEILYCDPKLIIYHDADMECIYTAIIDTFNGNNDYELYRVNNTRIVYALKKIKMENNDTMLTKSDKVAIVIVVYNIADLITKQIQCIRRFCQDDVDIIIIDNSTKREVSDAIVYYNKTILNCTYYKTQASSSGGSDSHAFACNWASNYLSGQYRYFCFLDHDIFPIRNFSVKYILTEKIIAGLGQKPKNIKYFWAGCVMFDADKIENNLIDFSTNHKLQIDTGGMLYKIIEKYGEEKCEFFNELHVQNENFNKSFYNFYSMINNEMFMHFINSSCWNPNEGHKERINSLLNILENKIKNY